MAAGIRVWARTPARKLISMFAQRSCESRSETVYGGNTVALPPPSVRGTAAFGPSSAILRTPSSGRTPSLRASTKPAAAVARSSPAISSSLQGVAFATGSTPSSAPTRPASRSSRSTFASIASSGTRPSLTAATSASPHGPCGPGMTRSSAALAAGSVERAAVQSDITRPSQPHSSCRTSCSSGDSVIVAPLTEL